MNGNLKGKQQTAADRAKVQKIADTFDLSDSSSGVLFGAGVQRKLSSFTDSVLKAMERSGHKEVDTLFCSLFEGLKEFTVEEKKGLFGRSKTVRLQADKMKQKYQSLRSTLEIMTNDLEAYRIQLLTDLNLFDELYLLSAENVRELELHALAGQQRLEQERTALENSTELEDYQRQDIVVRLDQLERRVHDLNIAKVSSQQFCLQLSLLRQNQLGISEQIRHTLTNVVPLWKSQMALMLGIQNAAEAAASYSAAVEHTNQLFGEAGKGMDELSRHITGIKSGTLDVAAVEALNEELVQTMKKVSELNEDIRNNKTDVRHSIEVIENMEC